MFANGTIGGSGYNFDISFFNATEISMVDDPCSSPYGHHVICLNMNAITSRIDNGIIVTDKWILTSATACLDINDSPWNDYFIHAGAHNLTDSDAGIAIKDYHIYAKDGESNENQYQGCNQNDDYCLIELETPLIISENIQAIGFQHFTSGSTTTDWTATWTKTTTTTPIKSTLIPSTTITTRTTLPTTTTSTGFFPVLDSDRQKRQAVPPSPPPDVIINTTTTSTSFTTTTSTTTWDSTWHPWLTTTTRSDTNPPTPPFHNPFDKCWIAAWSDNILRTFKVDAMMDNNYCYAYFPSEHSPFLKHKLSLDQKVEHEKKMEAYKKAFYKTLKESQNSNTKATPPATPGSTPGATDLPNIPDFPNTSDLPNIQDIIDAIMNPQGTNWNGERSHICIDNLRHVCIDRYLSVKKLWFSSL